MTLSCCKVELDVAMFTVAKNSIYNIYTLVVSNLIHFRSGFLVYSHSQTAVAIYYSGKERHVLMAVKRSVTKIQSTFMGWPCIALERCW